MNAAARLVHQNGISKQLVLTNMLSFNNIGAVLLVFAVLLSALSTIYITQMTREANAAYQSGQLDRDRLQVERGQLLLERSTLMMQTRVQQVAEHKLGMVVPDHKKTIIVR